MLNLFFILSLFVISIVLKHLYTSANILSQKISDTNKKQAKMVKVINHLVDVCKAFNNTLSTQKNQISLLQNAIEEQKKFISDILQENQKLKKDLEFYTEINADSMTLNTEDSLPTISTNLLPGNEISKITLPIPINDLQLDSEQNYAFDLLNNSDKNLFITGKAGTGKSYLLKKFANETLRNVLLLAPTGISAINIHGTTIHSAFGFDNLSTLQLEELNSSSLMLKKEQRSLLKAVDIFIIDEISMVRADVFEKINKILQIIMHNDKPFGGKRFILFGDLYQLPPIAKKDEIKYLNTMFGGIFFFLANAYKNGNFEFIELTINHRQEKDKIFFNILNNIRQDTVTDNDIDILNKRFCADESSLRRVIRLFSTKDKVDKINKIELDNIPGKEYIYKSVVQFYKDANKKISESSFPISTELKLKTGALVMMVTNDIDKRWVNGTLGIVSKLTDTSIEVTIDGMKYDVTPFEFKQQEAIYKNGKIEYIPVLTVKQFPLVLAYAITIHKSQGMTYQKVACDISNTFAKGQAYVALSRCSSLDGLFLLNEISKTSVFSVDKKVKEFYQNQTDLLKHK